MVTSSLRCGSSMLSAHDDIKKGRTNIPSESHRELGKPINSRRVGRHTGNLSPRQVEEIVAMCRSEMEFMGYDVSGVSASGARQLQVSSDSAEEVDPMRTFRPISFSFLVAALLVAFVPAQAMSQERPTLTTDDYGQWERLGASTLSADGRWLANSISRVNEENELRIRPLADSDSIIVVAYGSSPEFSANGQWLAYGIGLSEEAREGLAAERILVESAVT